MWWSNENEYHTGNNGMRFIKACHITKTERILLSLLLLLLLLLLCSYIVVIIDVDLLQFYRNNYTIHPSIRITPEITVYCFTWQYLSLSRHRANELIHSESLVLLKFSDRSTYTYIEIYLHLYFHIKNRSYKHIASNDNWISL